MLDMLQNLLGKQPKLDTKFKTEDNYNTAIDIVTNTKGFDDKDVLEVLRSWFPDTKVEFILDKNLKTECGLGHEPGAICESNCPFKELCVHQDTSPIKEEEKIEKIPSSTKTTESSSELIDRINF